MGKGLLEASPPPPPPPTPEATGTLYPMNIPLASLILDNWVVIYPFNIG